MSVVITVLSIAYKPILTKLSQRSSYYYVISTNCCCYAINITPANRAPTGGRSTNCCWL